MNKTENMVVRTACYTNHKTKQTAVALTLATSFGDAIEVFQGEEKYGRLWLEAIGKMLLMIQLKVKHGDVHIKLVSGDPNCVLMAGKLEKMLIKLLTRKKEVTRDVIDKVVYAQGQFKRLPNDELYGNVLTLLWQCKQRYDHFNFEQVTADTSIEYKMAKLAVDPTIMKKSIPLKG